MGDAVLFQKYEGMEKKKEEFLKKYGDRGEKKRQRVMRPDVELNRNNKMFYFFSPGGFRDYVGTEPKKLYEYTKKAYIEESLVV